jgi:hypothetical protein
MYEPKILSSQAIVHLYFLTVVPVSFRSVLAYAASALAR